MLSHFSLFFPIALLLTAARLLASRPEVGDRAPDFTLTSLQGTTTRLSDIVAKGRVVLLVLRGYPGYQCPICNRQVQDYIRNAQGFADTGAQVVMVYPGPAGNLDERAKEFTAGKKLPENFTFLLDPGYQFTNLYGLRWNAQNETAYPSTFLIDRRGIIFFVKISSSHGERTKATEIIDILKRKTSLPQSQ